MRYIGSRAMLSVSERRSVLGAFGALCLSLCISAAPAQSTTGDKPAADAASPTLVMSGDLDVLGYRQIATKLSHDLPRATFVDFSRCGARRMASVLIDGLRYGTSPRPKSKKAARRKT